MAAIGRMVVSAATLEYSVAVLVALTEGHQDQAAEDRALQLIQKAGALASRLIVTLRDQPCSWITRA